ncbi:MAG: N-acyl homoserine lactonase family protein [Psychrosphaera sp.]|nr:N-acyl homoserine lactonase family protein [Psychrosphaera sp.]
MTKRLLILPLLLLTLIGCSPSSATPPAVKLYAMDCGITDISDMSDFSIEGKYKGEKLTLVYPCFLISHPKGDLIWDTGMPQSIADMPGGLKMGVFHMQVKANLKQQLSQLNMTTKDIEFLSLSHSHFDHVGNANLFAQSTFIVNAPEHQYMFSDYRKQTDKDSLALYSELEKAKTTIFNNEHDVFGDGTVMIKSMPGHTVGSAILMLKLAKAGPVFLTGDLYTHARARSMGTFTRYHDDQAQTQKSRQAFEALVKQQKARVIIQHEKADYDALPAFPAYLE